MHDGCTQSFVVLLGSSIECEAIYTIIITAVQVVLMETSDLLALEHLQPEGE